MYWVFRMINRVNDPIKKVGILQDWPAWMRLTNSVAPLAGEGGQALNVGASISRRAPPLHLPHEMFGKLGEEGRATAGHQVAQSDDGTFPDCHAWTGQLRKQTGQDGLVKADQSAAEPEKATKYHIQ